MSFRMSKYPSSFILFSFPCWDRSPNGRTTEYGVCYGLEDSPKDSESMIENIPKTYGEDSENYKLLRPPNKRQLPPIKTKVENVDHKTHNANGHLWKHLLKTLLERISSGRIKKTKTEQHVDKSPPPTPVFAPRVPGCFW